MDWPAFFHIPYIAIVGPAVLFVGTALHVANIYRRGFISGGPTGKVYRSEADFRWRIVLMWIMLVLWLAILTDNLIRLFGHH